jgi:hypothetical protein
MTPGVLTATEMALLAAAGVVLLTVFVMAAKPFA